MLRFGLAALLLAPTAMAQSLVSGGTLTSARQAAASGAASFTPTDDPAALGLNPALLPGLSDGIAGALSQTPVPFADGTLAATGSIPPRRSRGASATPGHRAQSRPF